jgi:type IX secretion system PorP/SprF family membrane protein
MRQLFLITSGLCLFISGLSQQTQPQYFILTKDKQVFNPSQVGINGGIDFLLQYNQKWLGFKGAPTTSSIFVCGRLDENIGIGGSVISYKSGLYSNFITEFNYAYTIKIDQNRSFLFGLKAGFLYQQLERQSVRTTDIQDPVMTNNDYNNIMFINGFGITYLHENISFDFSIPRFLEGTKLKKDFYSMISYEIDPGKGDFMVTPFASYRYIQGGYSPFALNMAVNLDKFSATFGYSTQKIALLSFGINYNSFQFSYSYGMDFGSLSGFSSGNHEIRLGYNLNYDSFGKIKKFKRKRN